MQESSINKKVYIFFTESNIGVHKINMQEEIFLINQTFIPFFDGNNWRAKGKILDKALIAKERFRRDNCLVKFLIGYDLDENGEFMASVLRKELIASGIKINNIYRTPLTERGYLTITNFIDIKPYKKYRLLDSIFRKNYSNNKYGILKACGLYFLQKNKGKRFKIPNSGTSTATVLYKNFTKLKGDF